MLGRVEWNGIKNIILGKHARLREEEETQKVY